jgi:sRNA-binding regulator protein Hfq
MGFRFLKRGRRHSTRAPGERQSFQPSFPIDKKPAASFVSPFSSWRVFLMSIHAIVPPFRDQNGQGQIPPQDRNSQQRAPQLHARKGASAPLPFRFPAQSAIDEGTYRQAELFYLQKQIQSQTPMVIVLEDGEQVEGCIEWYDRICLKIRGRAKTLIYKSAIKYMYKLGEQGQ